MQFAPGIESAMIDFDSINDALRDFKPKIQSKMRIIVQDNLTTIGEFKLRGAPFEHIAKVFSDAGFEIDGKPLSHKSMAVHYAKLTKIDKEEMRTPKPVTKKTDKPVVMVKFSDLNEDARAKIKSSFRKLGIYEACGGADICRGLLKDVRGLYLGKHVFWPNLELSQAYVNNTTKTGRFKL